MITKILHRQENYVKAFSKQTKCVTGVRTHTHRGVCAAWTLEDSIWLGVKENSEKQMKEWGGASLPAVSLIYNSQVLHGWGGGNADSLTSAQSAATGLQEDSKICTFSKPGVKLQPRVKLQPTVKLWGRT